MIQTTHFIANGELQTAYHETGRGTPLLLVHGFTGSKLDFQTQMPWFSERHRVVAYDHRGHGESGNLRPYTIDQLAADLVGFLDALEISQCHVLGHSLGGRVVLQALLEAPDRFASAVLMDTAPYPLKLWDEQVRERLNQMVLDGGCEALLDSMRDQPQPDSVQRGIEFLGEHEHWRRVQVKLEQMDAEAFVEFSQALGDAPSLLDRLGDITQPTTVLVGAEDTPFLKPSRALADGIPGSRLVTIPRAAHSPQYENAETWRSAVEEHLKHHA